MCVNIIRSVDITRYIPILHVFAIVFTIIDGVLFLISIDGWSSVNREFEDFPSTKTQILSLMKSIRTVVKCMYYRSGYLHKYFNYP